MAWMKRRPNGTWYLFWYEGHDSNGKPLKRMKSLKTRTKALAERVAKEQKETVYLRTNGIETFQKRGIQEFIPALESKLHHIYRKKLTIRKYLDHFKSFAEYMEKTYRHITYMHEIKGEHIDAFLMHSLEHGIGKGGLKGKSRHTVNSEKMSLYVVFDIAKSHGVKCIKDNPTYGIKKLKAPPPDPQPYSQDEILLMLRYLPGESATKQSMIRLLLETGIRRDEIPNFYWSDFDEDKRMLAVTRKPDVDWDPKHDRERTLFLSKELTDLISQLPRGDGKHIFIQDRGRNMGQQFSSSGIWTYIVTDYCKKLGIPKAGPHRFRDSYACYALACGVDIATVRENMGHSDLSTTSKYVRRINGPIHDDVRKLYVWANEGR
jgi:integrase/recombinase XerD